jgi:hypothetical protein
VIAARILAQEKALGVASFVPGLCWFYSGRGHTLRHQHVVLQTLRTRLAGRQQS